MGCRCLRREDSESESDSEPGVEALGADEGNGSLNGVRTDGDDVWEGVEEEGKESEVFDEEIGAVEPEKDDGKEN